MKELVGRTQNKRALSHIRFIVSTLAFSLILAGCLTEGSGSEGDTDVVGDPSEVLPPLTTPEQTICDPFNAGISARDRGLIGHLVYLTDDQPRYTSARDYVENGTPVQSTLYFDKLFIPTRKFDLGFYTQDGQLILNHKDEPLYEYFGVRLESQLRLAPGEPAGYYELALLSDDGSILYQKDTDNGQLTPLVNNDGTHPTRMGCGTKAIYMDEHVKLPVVLEYYQGPRYHISMVAMWRPIQEGQDPNNLTLDEQCGREGNDMYFNYNKVPSEPKATYYELLTRGWKPLENANYYFPEQASNPCGAQDPLLISNFQIISSTQVAVTVSWQTNLPSTTKAEVKNVVSGVITSSDEDLTLKTSHTVTVTGLTPNTLYAVKAISTVPGAQSAISDERAFRTSR